MENKLKIYERYFELLDQAHDLIGEMKIWLSINHKNVDWSSLSIELHNSNTIDNTNKNKKEYFSKEPFLIGGKVFRAENPVLSFDCVLDIFDYDFSVTINDKEFWWIPDNDVTRLYWHGVRNLKQKMDWIKFLELNLDDVNVDTYIIDTRDFCAKAEKTETIPVFQNGVSKKEFVETMEHLLGVNNIGYDGHWRYLTSEPLTKETENWGLKYLKVYKKDGKFFIHNERGEPLSVDFLKSSICIL